MALTTIAGVQAGMRPPIYFDKTASNSGTGRIKSMWGHAGQPAAGAWDSTLNGVVCDNTTVGSLQPFVNPASGNSYLTYWELSGDQANSAFAIFDRLWHNGGYTITSTSAQNSTTPTWPARDVAGSTNGDGVMLFLEISATVGAATPTVTVSYTNSAGTSGRTGTNIELTGSAQVKSTVVPISLQAGDTGVRSVQSLTLSASWISGTMNLVAARPIVFMDGTSPNQGDSHSWSCQSGGLLRVFDSSCLYMMQYCNTTTGASVNGVLEIAQG